MGSGVVEYMGVSSKAFCSGRDVALRAGGDVMVSFALPKVCLGGLIGGDRLE